MNTIIKIQSDDKESIELFFELLGKGIVAKGSDSEIFESGGVYTAIFKLDFRGLQRVVKKKKKVPKPRNRVFKQFTKKNVKLSDVILLERSKGMSFQKIADKMNENGYTNSRGLKMSRQQVYRLYEQYKKGGSKSLEN